VWNPDQGSPIIIGIASQGRDSRMEDVGLHGGPVRGLWRNECWVRGVREWRVRGRRESGAGGRRCEDGRGWGKRGGG